MLPCKGAVTSTDWTSLPDVAGSEPQVPEGHSSSAHRTPAGPHKYLPGGVARTALGRDGEHRGLYRCVPYPTRVAYRGLQRGHHTRRPGQKVTKSKDSKRRKAEILGMPVGTAERKLRKALIHELARQAGKNFCRWCRLEIEEPDELAIIHVEDWEESPDRYFDLGNVALSHASCAADRGGRRQGESEMKIEVSVEDAHGNKLPGVRHEGDLYIGGKKGKQYQVKVTNRTGRRLLVATTVDGRNVQTGDPGDYDGAGHVLEPHQGWTYKGWRTSDDEVAAFRFGSKGESYSSQMGSKENVGVIGVAVFEELEPEKPIITIMPCTYIVERPAPRSWETTPWITYTTGGFLNSGFNSRTVDLSSVAGSSVSVNCSSDSSPIMGSSVTFEPASSPVSKRPASKRPASKRSRSRRGNSKKMEQRQELGTEFGETLRSGVQHTSFDRATDEPVEVHAIRYDSIAALRQQGIHVDRPSQRTPQRPSPFPESQDGYCQPPPGPRRHASKR